MHVRGIMLAGALLLSVLPGCSGCGHETAEGAPAKSDAPIAVAPNDAGPPAPQGMVWVAPGMLRAGTPKNTVPRITEEEMPGVEETLTGYWIDALPYPDEPGAIPTSNVSRDEAAQLCSAKGKRLCTELEWEHACKGASNTTYEYGDTYAADKCGTGQTIDEAAKRPSGDRIACKSGFGVREMHGGPWEWTSSAWGRGRKDDIGVLRGGNSVAGELVGRCANAIGRAPTTKSPVMGFRCCKGDPNAAKVELSVSTGRALEPQMKTDSARIGREARAIPSVTLPETGKFFITSSWTWRPAPNESLVLASGCAAYENNIKPVGCALFVFRPDADPSADLVLAGVTADVGIGEMVLAGDSRHVRVRGLLSKGGLYARDVTYVYGRVVIGDKTK